MVGMSDHASALTELHASLDQRHRPEEIAELILATGRPFTPSERALLERAASRSARRLGYVTSMNETFARPVGASRQLATLNHLFTPDLAPVPAVDAESPEAVMAAAARAGRAIGWNPGEDDFLSDRLDREQRRAAGIELSKRQYNRRFRALRHLAAKTERLAAEQDKRRLVLRGRSGFADAITLGSFQADPDAACFVAYYVARRNLRRAFTLSGRQNAVDEIAEMLLSRCGDGADWWMIAQVNPAPGILARLTDIQRGELLGRWSAVMRECADRLETVWSGNDFDREDMIVFRRDDSSTWNTLAQAYNRARSAWLSCLAASGALELLDAACPGKVMRLMAYDLVRWHRSIGGDVDPETRVWARLPFPWDVLNGRARCTRRTVEMACLRAGINAGQRGWTAPLGRAAVAPFQPTPELVHGVTVADPVWASLLRSAGAFSGKRVKPELAAAVRRACATGVVPEISGDPGSGPS